MQSDNPPREAPPDDVPALASIDLENGDLVVYDSDNHEAWIQSDAAVALADRE